MWVSTSTIFASDETKIRVQNLLDLLHPYNLYRIFGYDDGIMVEFLHIYCFINELKIEIDIGEPPDEQGYVNISTKTFISIKKAATYLIHSIKHRC